MATCRFSRADGKEFARPRGSTLAANGRPSAGDARGDPSRFSAGRPRPMAATDSDRRRPIDPYAEFFISYDGQICFRGLVNRQQPYFENYQNYWCMYPTAVNNVEALENGISWIRFAYGACSKRRNAHAGSGLLIFWMTAPGSGTA
jgi:hypothetical protein